MCKLSIIITVYNKEKYISRCIESALNQNIDNYEIIIVNDGSTDNSHNIIKKYAEKYSDKINYINKKNEGVSSARNMGLKESKGEFITFIDADDYANVNCYNEVYKLAKNNSYDIVVYDAIQISNDEEIDMEALIGSRQGVMKKSEYILSIPAPWNKIIRRDIFERENILFPEGICYEDFAIIPTLANYTDKIYYYKKKVINYFLSENSIMRQEGFKDRYLDIFKATEIVRDNLKEEFREEVEYLFINHLLIDFALIFYKYNRDDLIDKISDIIRKDFPNWKKNKYLKNQKIKNKIYATLFYYKKYNLLRKLQKVKKKWRKK